MSPVLPYLLGFAMAATLVVLFIGLVAFAGSGKFHARHANTLMRARVVLQGVTVALLALAGWFSLS